MDLDRELVQALRAFIDGTWDARAAYGRLARLGPAIDAEGDATLLDLWDQAFALLSQVSRAEGGEEAVRDELRDLIGDPRVTVGAWVVASRTTASESRAVSVATNVGPPVRRLQVRFGFERKHATA